jgi:DNA-binding protein H-NS
MKERAPQSLDEHIVHPTAPTVHRDANASCRQHAGKDRAGELATLVGDERLRKLSERVRERRPNPKVFPKYRNPKNRSETWTGRGKQPRWLVATSIRQDWSTSK